MQLTRKCLVSINMISNHIKSIIQLFSNQCVNRTLPIDGANTRNFICITDSISDQTFTNFPSKHRGCMIFVIINSIDNFCCSDFWFTSTDNTRTNRTSFMKSETKEKETMSISEENFDLPAKNFADTSV